MTEITISNVMVFGRGFIVRSASSLSPNTDYVLNIQYPGASINRTYRSVSSTSNILDTWGTDLPVDNDNVCFLLDQPSAQTGNISCTSTPSGAQVILDGNDTGYTTPVTFSNIVTGNHTVTFRMMGYNDCMQTVNVLAGQTVPVSCTLSAIVSGANFIHEITLYTTNNYANPYTEVSLSATFTKGTLIYNIPGFWDGGTTWKLRFRPVESGLWNFTTSSNDSQMNNITGSLNADISQDIGYVQNSDIDINGWQTSLNKAPHFWISDTLWRWNDNVTITQFQEFVDVRRFQKYNHIRGHLNSMDPATNEGGQIFLNNNYDTINPLYFQGVDIRFNYAHNNGITMDLCLGSGSRFPLYGPKTIIQLERYLKYIIARYSAYNVNWEGLSEYEEYPSSSTFGNAINLINIIGNYLKNNDPYQHPRSTHTLDNTKELLSYGWMNWIMYQTPGENPSNILVDRVNGLPCVNEEYWYERDPCSPNSTAHNGTSDQMRKGAWKILFSGGYFATGNSATTTGSDNTYYSCGLYGVGVSQMMYLHEFWSSKKFWMYKPNNSIIISGTANLMEIQGLECVTYLPSGGNVSLNLSSYYGSYEYMWYNTRNGTYQGQNAINGGSTVSFTAPDTNDWVLYIYNGCPQPIVGIALQ